MSNIDIAHVRLLHISCDHEVIQHPVRKASHDTAHDIDNSA